LKNDNFGLYSGYLETNLRRCCIRGIIFFLSEALQRASGNAGITVNNLCFFPLWRRHCWIACIIRGINILNFFLLIRKHLTKLCDGRPPSPTHHDVYIFVHVTDNSFFVVTTSTKLSTIAISRNFKRSSHIIKRILMFVNMFVNTSFSRVNDRRLGFYFVIWPLWGSPLYYYIASLIPNIIGYSSGISTVNIS